MITRISNLLACLAAAAVVVEGLTSTRTDVRCASLMGSISPYRVPTHTTTLSTSLPTVTIAFTTQPTSIITFEPVSTYHKTETTVSTITKTVTEEVKGTTAWTTTSTVHIYDRRYVNITDISHSISISSEPYTIHLQVPTMDGWLPVNTSTKVGTITKTLTLKDGRLKTTIIRPTRSRRKQKSKATARSRTKADVPPITDVPGPAEIQQIIYILEDGRLVPTPLSAVTSLITATDTATPTDESGSDSTATPAEGNAEVQPLTTDTATDQVTTIPGDPTPTSLSADQESEAELVKHLLNAMASAEAEIAAAKPTDLPAVLDKSRPDDERPLEGIAEAEDSTTTASDDTATDAEATATSTEADATATNTLTDKDSTITPAARSTEEEFDDDEDLMPDPESTTSTQPTATTIEITTSFKRSIQATETPNDTVPAEGEIHLQARALTKVPRHYYGLRGAVTPEPTLPAPRHLTELACTKFIYHETTEYAPFTLAPTFAPATPITLTTTTLKCITITTTIPSPAPLRTATHITTTTITTTSTHFTTSTWISTQIHTVSSTRTALAACATQNLLGPTAYADAHIVNIYSHGPYKYTSYDVGLARDAEECCAECHEMLVPCLGSVWDNRAQRCYLVSDWRNQCAGQGGGAGVFVTRPRDERQGRGRHEWPEWVVSNGPCGGWVDGGTGW
ncbi:hypothetical protein BDZ85DRAFT_90879 [Elsinoe ampelina]|uniref:Apple domain-containing protein n=1 Tax=Elsinoe ampelina TaxID=302913 RepID=A0A6A6GHS0_9PEZI|nr:hypothetical protein BDZ85DRAFT_90879 [Elsinoe ampelina]